MVSESYVIDFQGMSGVCPHVLLLTQPRQDESPESAGCSGGGGSKFSTLPERFEYKLHRGDEGVSSLLETRTVLKFATDVRSYSHD